MAERRRWAVGWTLFVGALIVLLSLATFSPPRPLLIWNVSASAPVGLYRIGGPDAVAAGDMVAARVPGRWRRLAGERQYIPVNVPLVKRVAAVPGDRVCAIGETVIVNGRRVARRRQADRRGRPMPWWTGCVTLRDGMLFLLMSAPDSFDGRYFGPTEAGDVIGRARLIWRR